MTEFNLKEKRLKVTDKYNFEGYAFWDGDVKEFIKLLKEDILREVAFMLQGEPYDIIGRIDKRSGGL